MTQKYIYGKEVLEFDLYKFDVDKLQAVIQDHEARYLNGVTTFVEDGLSANVNYRESPFKVALPKLLELHDLGYTLRLDRYADVVDGVIDVTLRKPQHIIDAELVEIRRVAADRYEADRYALNAAETSRQVEISLARTARDAEKQRQQAEQKAAEAARQKALAELRAEYHPA